MSTTETENGAVAEYVPFTPFQESYAFEAEPSTLGLLRAARGCAGRDAVRVRVRGRRDRADARRRPSCTSCCSSSTTRSSTRCSARSRRRRGGRHTTVPSRSARRRHDAAAEQFLEQWSAPVREQAEAMLDNIAQAVSRARRRAR